jgi:hypothetical protein
MLLPKLYWTPGVFGTSFDVYFGTSFDEVNEAIPDSHPNVTLTTVDVNELSITENLEFSTPYYWRVDDNVGPEESLTGSVWQFTTGRYSLIDDFESYPNTNKANDDSRIFVTWRDKYEYRDANNNRVAGNGTRMIVGTDSKPETDKENGLVYKGAQSLPLTYENTKSPYKSETDRTFDPPYDFNSINNQSFETLDMQIRGRFEVTNGYTVDSNGRYTVIGSGSDIFGNSQNNYEDEFHYVYQTAPLESPSGSISAKIVSVENVHNAAKAGVMIRDMPENADAVYAAVVSLPDGDIVFQYRSAVGTSTTNVRPKDHEFTLPYWVKISIDGTSVTAQMSADGQNWVNIGEPVNISMINYTVCGLAVTSHENAGIPCTAVFEDVKVEVEGEEGFTVDKSVDVGLEKNDPADIYVRLEDTNGASATAYYDDNPNGVFVDPEDIEWKLFSIPLSEFAGVDLTQISKMVIGIGDGQSVGQGKIYVDDVRLTLPDL